MTLFSDQTLRWLVTGAAGFIGSHLVRALLENDQHVVGIDNFLTSSKAGLGEALVGLPPSQAARFQFIAGDLRDEKLCFDVMKGTDMVLHHAALASVPHSLAEPLLSHAHNVTTMVNLLEAARQHRPKAFVYASSSAVYGDDPALPKVEKTRGVALSPYALAKQMLEDYAALFHGCYGLSVIGLRYFNVFGPRQMEGGPYAAVIPAWAKALKEGRPCVLFGDGSASRDFVSVHDIVKANLLAANCGSQGPVAKVYNIGTGVQTSLLTLYEAMAACWDGAVQAPHFQECRLGDIPHSVADIGRATLDLGYVPTTPFKDALFETLAWYRER